MHTLLKVLIVLAIIYLAVSLLGGFFAATLLWFWL